MNKEIKEVVKYLKSINVDGVTIKLDKKLFSNLEKACNYIYTSDYIDQILQIDKLGEIGMGFDYFDSLSDADDLWTITVDASEAIEDILYGVYLAQWFKDHQEGDPACYLEFRDNDYYILGE